MSEGHFLKFEFVRGDERAQERRTREVKSIAEGHDLSLYVTVSRASRSTSHDRIGSSVHGSLIIARVIHIHNVPL